VRRENAFQIGDDIRLRASPAPGVINHRKLKVDAMHHEVAGDQHYDDHNANYSEDVHGALPVPDNSVRRASTLHVYT
jgi:hypothetical protein